MRLTKGKNKMPDAGVHLDVYEHDSDRLLTSTETNSQGEARIILPSVSPNFSLDPDSAYKPYLVYDIRASHAGEVPVLFKHIQIMPDITTVQQHEMLNSEENPGTELEIVDNPDNINDHASMYPPSPIEENSVPAYTSVDTYRPVVMPQNITVHLGPPGSNAPNVTIPFIDYIKSVASSEIYPTWPEAALEANILAQITLALNRIYTEWYRAQGYDFDITSSPSYDQYYVDGRATFENIDAVVDRVFSTYVARSGHLEPIFTEYCDGNIKNCLGLHQWGTVDLANQFYSPLDILRYYYGDNVYLKEAITTTDLSESFPGLMQLGDSSPSVALLENRLNRIAINYPAIPFIEFPEGVYDLQTEFAVAEFQHVFGIPETGMVDRNTWYRIIYAYNAVKKLAELESEGERINNDGYPNTTLMIGSKGLDVLRMENYLNRIGQYYTDTIPPFNITGNFDNGTRNAVKAFQQFYGLEPTGLIDRATWDAIVTSYYSLPQSSEHPNLRAYPGIPQSEGSSGSNVRYIQNTLNAIGEYVDSIPNIEVDGYFGPVTRDAVIAFQTYYGLTPDGIVGAETWNRINDLYSGILDNEESADVG